MKMICKSCTCEANENEVTAMPIAPHYSHHQCICSSWPANNPVFKSWSSPDLTRPNTVVNSQQQNSNSHRDLRRSVLEKHYAEQISSSRIFSHSSSSPSSAAAADFGMTSEEDKCCTSYPTTRSERRRSRSTDSFLITAARNALAINGLHSSPAYQSQTTLNVCPSSSADDHGKVSQSRVSTTLSWDSGYNDGASTGEIVCDAFSPIVDCSFKMDCHGQESRSFRMPSVVISDCSEDPAEMPCFLLGDHPSPTPSQYSNDNDPCWNWTTMLSSPRNSLTLSHSGPNLAEELTRNLLLVRRLSDCSSCSSLSTLDVEPCLTPSGSKTFFQSSEDFSFELDEESDMTKDLSSKYDDRPAAEEQNELVAKDLPKISPWRKVRSAVQWSPFVQTFRRQRYPWVQLAGHQGNFKLGGEKGTILKKLCPKEEVCFQLLMQDPLRPFIPQYKGNVAADDGEKFLVLEDLLGEFHNPCVMDCKLGVRTYLEEELAKAKLKPKLRKDMFEKMLQVDPTAPTAEELRLGGVTKPRYMVWRETISSTATLGFRIEGVRKQDGTSSKDYKTVRSKSQILNVLREFIQGNSTALHKYAERLRQLETTLENSEFFSTHELIGSSLLFIHDQNKANVWMIDFAKTYRLPNGIKIDHKSPWVVGNHEDGYLTGLSHLIELFQQLIHERHKDT